MTFCNVRQEKMSLVSYEHPYYTLVRRRGNALFRKNKLKEDVHMMTATKDFSEMTNTELFSTLAGGKGVLRQAQLQNILSKCRESNKERCTNMTLAEMIKLYYAAS